MYNSVQNTQYLQGFSWGFSGLLRFGESTAYCSGDDLWYQRFTMMNHRVSSQPMIVSIEMNGWTVASPRSNQQSTTMSENRLPPKTLISISSFYMFLLRVCYGSHWPISRSDRWFTCEKGINMVDFMWFPIAERWSMLWPHIAGPKLRRSMRPTVHSTGLRMSYWAERMGMTEKQMALTNQNMLVQPY